MNSSIDTWMINTIAKLGNNKFSRKSIGRFLSTLGIGTNALIRFSSYYLLRLSSNGDPLINKCVTSTTSASLTYILGKAAIAYFIEHKKNNEIIKKKIKELNLFFCNGSSDERVPMDSQFIEDMKEVSKTN